MYIRVINGSPAPYTISDLRRDFPRVSFPRSFPPALLARYDIYEVQETAPPSYDAATQKAEAADPVETSPGVWEQQWTIVAMTAQEQSAYAQRQQDIAARQAIQADTPVVQLLRATPTQINTYIDNNVTDLASARALLKILARAVSVTAQSVFD